MKHLQCSVCGYIPTQEDCDKTGYHLDTCDCGQQDVCDLCLTVEWINNTIVYKCPICSPDISALGADRKRVLEMEYSFYEEEEDVI